jgi:D-glycero-alpha-D-manno-heptose-7-phosphate kinase
MIITKTPYRISFFGGGSDYPIWYNKFGGKVLSTTIDKHLYLTCRSLPNFWDHSFRVVWSMIEEVKNIESIKHPTVRSLLKYLKIKKGLEIHYNGDLPAKTGMGSSSSFTVGLIKTLSIMQKQKLSGVHLAKKTIFFEQKIMKEVVGSQDQVAASIGGFNKINFYKKNKIIITKQPEKNLKKLNSNLMLLYTGIQRTAQDIAKTYEKNLTGSKEKNVLKIMRHVDQAEKLIKNGELKNFGELLNESWEEKKKISKLISNNKIDKLYNFSLKNGAVGGKLLGAGGGGFLLLYVPKEKQLQLTKKLKKTIIVPFKFSQNGSEEIK